MEPSRASQRGRKRIVLEGFVTKEDEIKEALKGGKTNFSGTTFFPADRILEHRITIKGRSQERRRGLQFLVEWTDGSPPSWEPEGNIKAVLKEEYFSRLLHFFRPIPAFEGEANFLKQLIGSGTHFQFLVGNAIAALRLTLQTQLQII